MWEVGESEVGASISCVKEVVLGAESLNGPSGLSG